VRTEQLDDRAGVAIGMGFREKHATAVVSTARTPIGGCRAISVRSRLWEPCAERGTRPPQPAQLILDKPAERHIIDPLRRPAHMEGCGAGTSVETRLPSEWSEQ